MPVPTIEGTLVRMIGYRPATLSGVTRLAPVVLLLAGCTTRTPLAPSVAIFGSYFPAWIICVVLGVVSTVIARQVLIKLGIDEHLPLPLVVYVCLTVTASIGYWFLAFGAVPQ